MVRLRDLVQGVRNGPNAFLGGFPRSGTTLACNLLNKVPGVVALHEPLGSVGGRMASGDRDVVLDEVDKFCLRARRRLLRERAAPSRNVGGEIPKNTFTEAPKEKGLRQSMGQRGDVRFEKALDPGFLLVVKQPMLITALLPDIGRLGATFGLVRDPIAVLGSWNSVDMPLRNGRAPQAERLDMKFFRELARIEDRFDRQIHVYEWFLHRFREHLPPERILRYEDVIASGGRALSVIAPDASKLDEKLESRNRNPAYGRDTMAQIAERLLARGGIVWDFYTRESVEASLAALRG